ncbi:MAG: carbon-nitrogen hydrolase [Desulfobacterales bacterium]
MASVIKSALIQMSCADDKKESIKKAASMVRDAACKGARIICLQELFFWTYFPQHMNYKIFELAEPVPGPTIQSMVDLAKKHQIILIVPIYEKAAERVYYNTAVIIDENGNLIGKYRKNHIPEFIGYAEKFYFKPGNLGYPVFATSLCKIGVSICYDQWFPEVSRILALNGAEIIYQPTAIGSDPEYPGYSFKSKWELVIRSQALENGIFIGVVNRVGTEDQMEFYGSSFFCDPEGEIIVQSNNKEDDIIIADLNFDQIKEWSKHYQRLRDRRPETYGDLIKQLP